MFLLNYAIIETKILFEFFSSKSLGLWLARASSTLIQILCMCFILTSSCGVELIWCFYEIFFEIQ